MEGAARRLVLYVDQVRREHDGLRRLLAGFGECTVAEAGDAALARLRDAPPDAVVVVRAEPAAAVLDALPRRRGLAAAAVVVLSGGAGPDARAELLRAGAHACVGDPVTPVELRAVVEGALAVKRCSDALDAASREHERQALTDPLTGLGNRRLGERELEQLVALATRHSHALAVIEVDVDGFKQVNDAHGHDAGDHVLREVAERLADTLRGGDMIARWGGEEFVAMLPDTGPEGARRGAERLRAAIADAPFQIGRSPIELTVSVGWADWRGEDASELMLRVDRALYQAKSAGRNTVRPL
jgi:two-component system cell cycle response regulator